MTDETALEADDLRQATSAEVVAFIKPERHQSDDPDERRTNMSTGEIMAYQPMTDDEIGYAIEQAQSAIDRYTDVMPVLVAEEYATKRAYDLAFSTARLSSEGGYDRDRAAFAHLATVKEREAMDLAHEKRSIADKLFDALKSKMYGWMNVNKANSARAQSLGHMPDHGQRYQ